MNITLRDYEVFGIKNCPKCGNEFDPEFSRHDGYSGSPYAHNGLDLTYFMVGWACNTLRFILHKPPVADGASIIVGGGDDQPVGVPRRRKTHGYNIY